MQRVLRDAPRELVLEVEDADGVPAGDTTAATLTVTDVAGVAMTGSPFTATVDAGVLTATLSAAALNTLGVYDLLWTITRPGGVEKRRDQLEVVGAHLYTLGQFRSRYDDFGDVERWTPDRLRRNRDAVEDLFDHYTSPAMRARRRRVVLDSNGSPELELPDMYVSAITSMTVDGTALSGPELAALQIYDTGHVRRASGFWAWGHRNIVIVYEHGLAQVPEDIHDAAMRLASATLTTPATPDRATSISTDTGSFRLTIAGKDGATGFPDVDAALNRWGAGNKLYAA